MKTYQSALPSAMRKRCREARLERVGAKLKGMLAKVFDEGFWYCEGCEVQCASDHCSRCGLPAKWNPPLDRAIEGGKLIQPGEL